MGLHTERNAEMKRFFSIAIVLVVGVIAGTVLAEDIYVRAGSEGNAGTLKEPFKDLWKATEKAMRGDVIHVAAGVYEGKGGCGHITIKTPNLTIAGGYNADFSERNPFKNLTIIQRAKDYKGDWTGLPEGIISGKAGSDHSGLIVDGFVLNGQSRNLYKPSGDINAKGSYKGKLFGAVSKNVKIRNCIMLNPYGKGIYCTWQGEENEISNCFVLNTFYAAISTRSAQPESKILIKNCTIFFGWFRPGMGGGMGIFIGNQGATAIQDNIIGFMQTEGGEAGEAVLNGFGNEDTIMKGNVFFQCQGGYYKYMDNDKKNLLVWKDSELKELNDDPENYMLLEAGGNTDQDPKCQPDKDYFERFSNTIASEPGKLNMDIMNEWRRSVGLPLQAGPGTARKNWGMAYPLEAVIPNLVSPLKGKGVQIDGPFEKYASKAAEVEEKNYEVVEIDVFKKGGPDVKTLAGKPVELTAQMGPSQMTFLLKEAPRSDYVCFQLVKMGQNASATRDFVYGYMLKGSEAHKNWQKYYKKRDRHNKKGLKFKGSAWYVGNDSYNYPVGIIIDDVSR